MKNFIRLSVFSLFMACITTISSCGQNNAEIKPEMDASAFVSITDVIPSAILEIRYYSTYNFIGDRIPGYEQPVALMTRQATDSLKATCQDLLKMGYIIKIYDAYRPQCAVDYFMKWGDDLSDVRMKDIFYPMLEKDVIIPEGYVARRSSHTRGSTIDLTLFDVKTGKELDMGSPFDYFGSISAPNDTTVTTEQYNNRMILRNAMLSHGFKPYESEWWHFTLKEEPFPETYFEFKLSLDNVNR